MVNTSKILTVSYGTFSCTLEGFDDSFDTMKAIAEYFRDLASDDRYFGAEPPVPDTEMLARIAEREISRRVEATESEGNYVLRAHSEAPQSKIADGAGNVAATLLDDASAEMPVLEDATQNDPSSLLADDTSVAEEPISTIDSQGAENIVETEKAETAKGDIEVPGTDGEAEFQGFINNPIAPADPDSVAAKLQRIRAVVSQEGDATADDSYIEDEHAVDFIGKTVSDLTSALQADDHAETATERAAETLATTLATTLAEEIETPGPAPIAEVVEPSNKTTDTVHDTNDANDDDDEISDFLNRMNANDEITDTTSILDDADNEDDNLDYSLFADDEAEEGSDNSNTEATEQVPPPVRARVMKMKRADFEAAVSEGQLEESHDEAVTPNDRVESTLSDQEEAELLRELADVEAGIDTGDFNNGISQTDDVSAAIDIENTISNTEKNTQLQVDHQSQEQDVSRILAKTNNQMDEPQGKTRREGIAHLRAAVAATVAEKAAGNDTTVKKDTSRAYRDDLAAVVRPRRPVSASSTKRPDRPAPAPLKLVAEQRIDHDAADIKPVRPRRVSMAQMAAQNELATAEIQGGNDYIGSFSEFAEEVGATKLPDLLEAAAAYLSFVEGREKFSRPQLMTKVRQVEQGDFSREDGLRSFGQLLRQGKIEKLKGGRFTVSDRISFKPDERHVG